MKRNEEKLAETEAACKQARTDLLKEVEHRKKVILHIWVLAYIDVILYWKLYKNNSPSGIFYLKAEQLRMAESSKLKEETAKTEQLTAQLKEARSNLKKMEKKTKQDE